MGHQMLGFFAVLVALVGILLVVGHTRPMRRGDGTGGAVLALADRAGPLLATRLWRARWREHRRTLR